MSRDYPIPHPDGEDRRFRHGLLFAVGRVLEERGYPRVTQGGDLWALRNALGGFIYGTERPAVQPPAPKRGRPRRFNSADHPAWCSPEHCAATDRLIAQHRGTPVTIAALQVGQPTITLQVWQAADEPLDSAPRSLVLTVDDSMLTTSVHGYDLEPWQATALVDELGPLVALLGGAR